MVNSALHTLTPVRRFGGFGDDYSTASMIHAYACPTLLVSDRRIWPTAILVKLWALPHLLTLSGIGKLSYHANGLRPESCVMRRRGR